MANGDALAVDRYDNSTTVEIRRGVCSTLGKVQPKVLGISKRHLVRIRDGVVQSV